MGDGAAQDGVRQRKDPGFRPPLDLRTDRPHSARVYDVLLGGKTNYRADREAVVQLLNSMPIARRTAVENRAFMHRAVRHLAKSGIRQFLDIGTGIPTEPNLHQVAQGVDPTARVVYADNDPIVLAHSRALHLGARQGRTAYVHGDICEPESILAEARGTLDFTQPVAVTLLTILHWLPAGVDAYALVRQLMEAVPAGSALVVTHVTRDHDGTSVGAAAEGLKASGSNVTPRTRAQVQAFFDGFDMVEPGLELVERWRPVAEERPEVRVLPTAAAAAGNGNGQEDVVPLYAAVGIKPR